MSTQKDNGKGGQGNPSTDDAEVRAAQVQVSGAVIVAIIGGIVTVLTTLIGVLAANGYFKPEISPTPTFTLAPAAPTLTMPPTQTDVPPTQLPTDTLIPTNTPIIPTPVPYTPVPCEWQSYSLANGVILPDAALCLGDVAFGNLGIADLGAGKVSFTVDNSQHGIFGMVLPLGPVQQIQKGYEFTVRLNIKELTAARFIVAFSPNPRPDVQSAYAIAINPDSSQLVTRYLFYRANEIPEQSIFSERPAISTTQGVNYTIKFVISYPNLVVDVNSGIFRPKARQIAFNGVGYIFIGYQRISSETARSRVRADVRLP